MSERAQSGIALIGVLWGIVLMTVLAAGLSANMRDDARLAGNLLGSVQARHAAEGGVQVALLALLARNTTGGWQAGDTVHELSIGEASVRVTLRSESGRIDLNRAPQALLEALLQSSGVDEEARRRLVAAILDWRDADSSPRAGGAEDPDYVAAGKPYGAKDGPFESVDELQLVLGMTPELFRDLQPALTVHSRLAGVNPEAASRPVLIALRKGDYEGIDSYLEEREDNRRNGLPAPPFVPAIGQPLVRTSGPAFRVHAQARLANGATAHVSAIVDMRARDPRTPFTVLDWRHEGPELFSFAGGENRWT